MDFDVNKYKYLTTYNKHYVQKPIRRMSKTLLPRQEFDDPISEGYRLYLKLEEDDSTIPPDEEADEYLEKFKANYKDTARVYFQKPMDKDVIIRNKITKGDVSEYQMNYCDIEKDIQYFLEKHGKKHNLPDDVKIPLTTYTSHYRDPVIYHEGKFEKPLIVIPPENVEISSGDYCTDPLSDYSLNIGRLGGLIVKNMYKRHQHSTKKEETKKTKPLN